MKQTIEATAVNANEHDSSSVAPAPPVSHPTWAPARKDMVGAGLGSYRLWFTIAEGIPTEVYYPRIDIPQIKDLGFIVADGEGFWVELRRQGDYVVTLPVPGVPAVEIVHRHPRFVFTLRVRPSHLRDLLLIEVRLEGDDSPRPYALLSTRLGGEAVDNLASVGSFGGRKMLWAEQGPYGLALAATDANGADAWARCSAGCSELSDGWTDFDRNGRMTWAYSSAGPAAVALMGELPKQATLALGFAGSKAAAAALAVSNLMEKLRPRRMHADQSLTVALLAPARVRCGIDGWKDVRDVETRDTGLGVHVADLPFGKLGAGQAVQFTFFWAESQAGEGRDYEMLARHE